MKHHAVRKPRPDIVGLAISSILGAAMAMLLIAHPATAETIPGVTNLKVVMILDQSGSMQANDPPVLAANGLMQNPGWRFAATNLLAEWLGIDQTGARHQMSVVMFGTDAKVVFPLQDIQTQDSRAALKKALVDSNKNMGATDVLKALRLARAELDKGRSDPSIKRAIIFVSDGVCQPADPNDIARTVECNRQVRELAQREYADGLYPIFTIALTSDATKGDPASTIYKNLWQEIAVTSGGDYFEPAKAGQELMDAIVRIQQRLFGLPAQSPPPPVKAPTSVSFDVPANLAQVAFSVIKFAPGISVTLARPGGKVAIAGETGIAYSRSDLTESYNAAQPASGRWTVQLTGQGQASVVMVPFVKTVSVIDRLSPRATHPQGKPMEIRVRVLDSNQTPTLLSDLEVVVRMPDGIETRVALVPDGAAYAGVFLNTSQVGTYELGYGTALGAQRLATQQVSVLAAPWLQVTEPRPDRNYPSNQPVPIRVLVMADTRPVGELKSGERLEVLARLLNANGQVVDSQVARADLGGVFSSTLSNSGSGRYTAQAQLSYVSPGGERFEDVAELPFTVRGIADVVGGPVPGTPVPASTPQSGISILGVILAPSAVVGGIAALGFFFLVSLALMASALGGMRRTNRLSLAEQEVMLRSQRGHEANLGLQPSEGWQRIASQLVADALNEPMAINGEAGFLDVVAQPYLKFTLLTRDGIAHGGREIIFTTNPGLMKRVKLIQHGDRIIDLTRRSASAHADAGLLWRAALNQRGHESVVPPTSAHWYVVARAATRYSSRRGLPGSLDPRARRPKAPQVNHS
ncbi:MAG: vWA domain-containing protein [Thermoflexales bacterium]